MTYPTKWYEMPRVSNEEALKADCPKCGAKKGESCVYIWESKHEPRVNQPTKHAHNERRVARSKDELAELNRRRAASLRSWLIWYGDIFKEQS